MNFFHSSVMRLCGIFLLVAFLSGCGSTVSSRIKRNPELFANLTQEHQNLVLAGRVTEGMPKDAVFLSWGRPDAVNVGSERRVEFQTWVYSAQQITEIPRFSPAYRYSRWDPHPVPMFYDPIIISTPFVYRTATFEKERLIRWTEPSGHRAW